MAANPTDVNRHYFTPDEYFPSFSEYLLVAQDAPLVTHYRRTEAGWVRRDVAGLDGALESSGCELRVSDIREGVTFDA